ncbi:hypothetical protein [Sulfuricurvum sp.]|uniref:hypothetical protein n=1 Tax=Sulfuricurvum sp. TaxID=2025608 RepID=UPI00261DC568|nr:hypothetical protein [Sulfuricurvum sp.]MDD2780978.1 hypothetical protein [Sulfuricurvum sp.]
MNLKQELINFGCGAEFIDIALEYAADYNPENDLEHFIEYVEMEYAKIEEAEAIKERDNEIVDASGLFEEFEDDKNL